MISLNRKDIHDGIFRSLYRGVPIQKFPFDYVIYQMIMNEIKPDLIIEIGTMYGGSALYFADLMDNMGIEGGEIHTIDVVDLYKRKETAAGEYEQLKTDDNYPNIIYDNPRIKSFFYGFKNYDLKNCEGFNKILVIDDGSHIYDDVIDALRKFKDVVSIGSYYIVEDGNALDINLSNESLRMFNGGPMKGISKFLSEDNNYTIDLKWCDMYGINSTYNTYGYLKRYK